MIVVRRYFALKNVPCRSKRMKDIKKIIWIKKIKEQKDYSTSDEIQLNEYDTAPYFLQLSQKMTSDSLLLCFSPFLIEFTCFAQKIVLNIKT